MAQRYAIQSDFGARKLGFARRATAKPYDAMSLGAGRACAGTARSRNRPVYGSRAANPAGSRGGAGGQPAFLGAVYGHAGERAQVEISLQGAERSQAEVGRAGYGTLDSFTSFSGKKRRDSQRARLRFGGVLGRTSGWAREAEGEGEELEATVSSQISVPGISQAPGTKLSHFGYAELAARVTKTEKAGTENFSPRLLNFPH